MQASAIGALAPLVLLCAAFGSWSLISLSFLLVFFIVQFKSVRQEPGGRPRPWLWISVVLWAAAVIVTEGVLMLLWTFFGTEGGGASESQWMKLLGLARGNAEMSNGMHVTAILATSEKPLQEIFLLNPWENSLGVFLTLVPQFAVPLTMACALFQEQHALTSVHRHSLWDEDAFQWRYNVLGFLLPTVQILVGVARPSWIAFPYFIMSCAGLFHWSMTGNFAGLSWGWMPLVFYTGTHITLLYLNQLSVELPQSVVDAADYMGLFKVSKADLGWPEGIQLIALFALYILLCIAVNNLEEEQQEVEGSLPTVYRHPGISLNGGNTDDNMLTESLLPPDEQTSLRETMNSRRWVVEQRRVVAFQHAIINFFTYGFPICVVALVCWSFVYISFLSFGLLLYVGYIFLAFPSIATLRWLNPVLLGFILLWALCTYVFNAAFSIMTSKFDMGMGVWHTIGLWHYSTPGLLIFALYALGVLVATDIFVSNNIVNNLTESESLGGEESSGNLEGQENRKWAVLAVIAWCVRGSSHVISLVLIFNVAMKDGLLHAVYMGFFLVYLVRSAVARSTRQHLIFWCELHFAVLFLLQLDWISSIVTNNEASLKPILTLLGLWDSAKIQDFVSIAVLLVFSAVQNHGLKVLSSLSATVQHSPQPPLGWGILRSGNTRSILLSVYATSNFSYLQQETNTTANWVTKLLATTGEKIRFTYHMFGTYIAYGTILLVIYSINWNYVSFGYLSLLLFWVIGRQCLGKSQKALWSPILVFSMLVFITRYTLSTFPVLQNYAESWISLYLDLGFDPNASVFQHIWDPLVILIIMEIFKFERAQNVLVTEDSEQTGDRIDSNLGYTGFLKRLLILHIGKLLTIAVFCAAIMPVSAIGFIYLIMLLATCNMSKTSRLPGQTYAIYTALVVMGEYLFQMWGQDLEMFPGQQHGEFAHWVGLWKFEEGFWGVEAGLRSRVLVLIMCIVQCTTLGWLELLPSSLRVNERYEEPCLLFLPYTRQTRSTPQFSERPDPSVKRPQRNVHVPDNQTVDRTLSLQLNAAGPEATSSTSYSRSAGSGIENETLRATKLEFPGGSSLESRRQLKRVMTSLKQERYDAQLRTLSIHVKHTAEHFFQLYGLELSMLALLISSFALLNVFSLLYIAILALCIILSRRALRTLWPFFVLIFASIMVSEYVVLGKTPPPWILPPSFKAEDEINCHDCWTDYSSHYTYCWHCWLGLTVDDRQMLVAHFVVFLVACFQLQANMSAGILDARSLHVANIPASDRIAWKEILYETTAQWTWLDYIRFFFYRHLLHVVLLLVFVTGTLQYDVLHLGYLAISLIFFRMRGTIMERRNSLFCFLRLYNFILIVMSLAYQAPYFGNVGSQKCTLPLGLYSIVGLYKYDYGFGITERSALVDITIFCLVGLQAHIFRTREFEQVIRYLEAQQVEARAHAQEDKAAWKKEQLQRIREMEERKQQRRQQVDKMKMDMHHMQLRSEILDSPGPIFELADRGQGAQPSGSLFSHSNTPSAVGNTPRVLERIASETTAMRGPENVAKRGLNFEKDSPPLLPYQDISEGRDEEHGNNVRRRKNLQKKKRAISIDDPHIMEKHEKLKDADSGELRKSGSDTTHMTNADKKQQPKQVLMSGVQFLEEGVAQVQSLGNKALANLVGLLNLEQEDDSIESSTSSTEDEGHMEKQVLSAQGVEESGNPLNTAVEQSPQERMRVNETWRRLFILCYFTWCQICANTDIVCYFFFVVVYVWNFKFLTLVFPAALFLYALLVNPGPSQNFWLAMLIYTEINIILQYCYQIYEKLCGSDIPLWLSRLGIPGAQMTHSFVFSVLPLFLVYLATLIQSSIKARDGEWMLVNESNSFASSRRMLDPEGQVRTVHRLTLSARFQNGVNWVCEKFKSFTRGISLYFQGLTSGSEAPPHFVQVSMDVGKWPEAGIQPERIESSFNRVLGAVQHSGSSHSEGLLHKDMCSRVRVESIESSPDSPHLALAVLEVIHTARSHGFSSDNQYPSLTPAADLAAELQKAKEDNHLETSDFPYRIVSIIPGGKREVDLYAFIFGMDLLTFLFVAVSYNGFIKKKLFEFSPPDDQFPKDFVYVLIALFFLIVFDRVLYLWSFATGKVLFYFLSLVLYTTYVSMSVWRLESYIEPDKKDHLLPLRVFYMMKALSLALQAVQIRYGLPHKSALYRQFLAHRIDMASWIGFRLYRALPFLFELRCVLDWSCTTTALNMYDWLKLEDIYGSLILVQCDIKLVREKHRLGQKQGMWIKFGSGVLLFLVLIAVIWAPMLIYSSGNPTNYPNPVKDVHSGIEVKTAGGIFQLYQTGLCHNHLLEDYQEPPKAIDMLESSVAKNDVQIVCCEPDAASLWLIPPRTLQSLIRSIDNDNFLFSAWWEFNRERPKGKELATYPSPWSARENHSQEGVQLKAVLNGTMKSIYIPNLYPRFFRVPGYGEVSPWENLSNIYVSGNLTLNREGDQMWWSFEPDRSDDDDGCAPMKGPTAVTVSDEVPPNGLIGETLSKFSIWSLYITFVLAVGRFIRLQCSDIRMRIPYENFPACDRLVAICEDIYAARAAGELELEEGLFWTLIKIYRAPYILMEYTKVE